MLVSSLPNYAGGGPMPLAGAPCDLYTRLLACSSSWSIGDEFNLGPQRAKKVVSDNPGLVDFSIGLVNSVSNLPNGQVMFFEEFE